MKAALRCCVVLLVVMVSVTAQALEPLVPYDNFNARLIDPEKWIGEPRKFVGSEPGGAVREAVRQVQNRRLYLANRTYGDTNSDSGFRWGAVPLFLANPSTVTAIAATVQVKGFKATGCANNPMPTFVGASVGGLFFNTGTPTPGDTTDDVLAAIEITRLSNSDPKNVFRVWAIVQHCDNLPCAGGEILNFQDLGTIRQGKSVRVQVQWDADNHQFIFQRDSEPKVSLPYEVSDTAPPGFQEKFLEVVHVVPNCTGGARPVAFGEAFFDDVSVGRER